MRNMSKRAPTNKGRSAKHFRNNVRRTDRKNVAMAPRRGGWRL